MPSSKQRNLRIGRHSESGRPYLVTAVTKNLVSVFQDWALGRLLVGTMKSEHESKQVASLAWVVMPDHLHWLFELQEGDISAVMRRVKSCSTLLVNRASGRSGPLWQTSFHDRALRREENVLAAARYVVANPLRAGLVQRLGDYPLWDAIWL
jgi:REP element-mobilizing transposase RayT